MQKFFRLTRYCHPLQGHPLRSALAVCAIAIIVSACSSFSALLKPELTQELVAIKGGNYQLDPDHSVVLFKVDHMGFSTFVGRFNRFDARLNYDAEQVEKSTLEAVVDMASVDVNNAKFQRALAGRFWFNTEVYPQAFFKTQAATVVADNILLFQGELSFLGVTQPLELRVQVNGAANNILTGKYTLGFSASSVFQRSAFGLDRYVPSVGDDITLEIHAEFQRM